MRTKKEIYKVAADQGIFLPVYQINKLYAEVSTFKTQKAQDKFLLNTLHSYKKYTNSERGAYSNGTSREEFLKKISNPVNAIDPDTCKVIHKFKSLYEAAQFLGKPTGYSNIRNALKKGTKAYGFIWQKDIPTYKIISGGIDSIYIDYTEGNLYQPNREI